MNPITDPKIEEYCRDRSEAASPVRVELEAHTHAHCEWPQMVVGSLVGSVLQFLVGISRAKRVLEIGCFTGYSALAMAEALPPDGDLLTLDLNPDTNRIAREFWDKSEHGSKIRSIVGDAHATLAEQSGPFDLVFIDAEKIGYRRYFDACLPLLSPTGFVVLDNCLMAGGVLSPAGTGAATEAIDEFNRYVAGREDLRTVLLPVRDGLMLVRPR